jgi:integrase/recombinase XerD
MSDLASCLEEYLALRRSLGYKLRCVERLLRDFVAFSDARGADHITAALALCWAVEVEDTGSAWRASRLGAVRCFARYAQAMDPAHEVPPVGLLPVSRRRPAPYIYSEAEIGSLMRSARELRTPLRAVTLETVIGLLAVSGARVGEVLRLDRGDLRPEELCLSVRNSKAGKSRIVPLKPSTVQVLQSFAIRRDKYCPKPKSEAMFVSRAGTRIGSSNLGSAFVEVLDRARMTKRPGDKRPRLGDLRHTFAVRTLATWHNQGLEIEPLLPLLSTVMGHVSPASTYWYLSQCPELLGAAARRLESTRGGAK